MGESSSAELLVLHGVRLRGMSTGSAVAARFDLDPAEVEELLLDDEAYGRVSWSEFAGSGGWSLTERGRLHEERLLGAELDGVPGARRAVTGVHEEFRPLNARLQQASTAWQIRPSVDRPMAVNDHRDPNWDARVLAEFEALSAALGPLAARLTDVLDRFAGYDARFAAALGRADAGDPTALTGVDHDSCHAVWFELHEDLLATLGIRRTG